MGDRNSVGYGVLRNGKPAGIWPLPLRICAEAIKRYEAEDRRKHNSCAYEIVPIYIGMAVTYVPPADYTIPGGSVA